MGRSERGNKRNFDLSPSYFTRHTCMHLLMYLMTVFNANKELQFKRKHISFSIVELKFLKTFFSLRYIHCKFSLYVLYIIHTNVCCV
jgi:hypothetical protein